MLITLRSGKLKSTRWALIILAFLTLFMTYPLPFRLGTHIRDYGDSLLNTWILATVADHLASLNFRRFFGGNIFYPEEKPLLYSEILLPQAVVALPLIKITGNPVLAHNIVLLLAILTSGWAMFFLARYLCGSFPASILAGAIYAFSPFMMAHTVQLQVVTAGGLPLAFLFLHRYFRERRSSDWIAFAFIYIAQSLANFYYALFLTIFAGVFVLLGALDKGAWREKRFWLHGAVFIVLVGLMLGPVLWQYARLQEERGFERGIGAEAKATSYLATGRINRLYGDWSARFRRPEGELFPGFTTVALAFLGIFSALLALPRYFDLSSAKSSLGSLQIPDPVSVFNPGPPSFSLTSSPGFNHLDSKQRKKIVIFYLLILALAVSLSFGSKGPFLLLHRFVPGFKAIRAVPRFHIFTMLALAVLASFGLAFLLAKIKRRGAASLVSALFLALILVEFASFPLPSRPIPAPAAMPPVYRWLASLPEKKVILELPFPEPGTGVGRVEARRMYYSLFHRHRLVNGYSGFFSPHYVELREKLKSLPLEENINLWRQLGVDFVILHAAEMAPEEFSRLASALKGNPYVQLGGQWDSDFLFIFNHPG